MKKHLWVLMFISLLSLFCACGTKVGKESQKAPTDSPKMTEDVIYQSSDGSQSDTSKPAATKPSHPAVVETTEPETVELTEPAPDTPDPNNLPITSGQNYELPEDEL